MKPSVLSLSLREKEKKDQSKNAGRKTDRPSPRPVPDVLCALRQDGKCVGVCH